MRFLWATTGSFWTSNYDKIPEAPVIILFRESNGRYVRVRFDEEDQENLDALLTSLHPDNGNDNPDDEYMEYLCTIPENQRTEEWYEAFRAASRLQYENQNHNRNPK
jgi:hypothetical protein